MPMTSTRHRKPPRGWDAKQDKRPIHATFQIKADSVDEGAHTFEGITAVWDLDLGDDVIHPGAFKKTIKEWRGSGRVIYLLDQHQQYGSVRAAVGKLVDAKEMTEGVWSKWELVDSPDGDEAFARLRQGIVNKLSIGYNPTRYDFEEDDSARFGVKRNLYELDWHESSLVLFPMAPGAAIDPDSVKRAVAGMNAETKAALLAALGDSHDDDAQELSPPDEDGDDDGAPDFSAFTALKLRRLLRSINR